MTGQCPTLLLMTTILDRTAIQTYGAKLLPDLPFLSRTMDLSPSNLATEMDELKAELRAVTAALLSWRREAPCGTVAVFDRTLISVIGACQELVYFDSMPVVPVISEHLERINGMMTDDHMHVHPTHPNLRIHISPTAGSDAAPVTSMSSSTIAAASIRLRSEALRNPPF